MSANTPTFNLLKKVEFKKLINDEEGGESKTSPIQSNLNPITHHYKTITHLHNPRVA